MIPANKLIFVQREFESCLECSAVVTDNREELYQILAQTSDNCKNYHHFRLIFPDNIYHKEIWEGFADYCLDQKIKFDISPGLCGAEITAGQLLIIKNDEDLAYAVKYCREHQLELGKDVGVICYNDSTLKEVLAGGISVITPDFHEIGRQVAKIVMTQDFGKSKGNYKFIRRGSF